MLGRCFFPGERLNESSPDDEIDEIVFWEFGWHWCGIADTFFRLGKDVVFALRAYFGANCRLTVCNVIARLMEKIEGGDGMLYEGKRGLAYLDGGEAGLSGRAEQRSGGSSDADALAHAAPSTEICRKLCNRNGWRHDRVAISCLTQRSRRCKDNLCMSWASRLSS